MADFCKECSINMFGEDTKDLANIAREGEAAHVLCESCGYIWVDSEGRKVDMKRKYWYKFYIWECVICGATDEYKVRQYTEKPENAQDRYEYREFACGIHFV